MSRDIMSLVGGIFALVGLVLLAASGYLLVQQQDFARAALKANGTVVALHPRTSSDRNSTNYAAEIAFTDASAKDHRFIENFSTYPARFDQGERVTVLYRPQAPQDAIVDDFWSRTGALIIVGPLALIFSCLGGGMLGYRWSQQKRAGYLIQNGLPIQAQFLRVVQDDTLTVNNRSPYRVIAQGRHPVSGQEQEFRSPMIWTDPGEQFQGQRLTVYVDPQRTKRYYMDVPGTPPQP